MSRRSNRLVLLGSVHKLQIGLYFDNYELRQYAAYDLFL